MEDYSKILENLNRRWFKGHFCKTKEEAKALALEIIGNDSVGFGGSITVSDLGIYDALLEKGNEMHWHWKVGTKEEKRTERETSLFADIYLASANALTRDGRVLNIDGTGNRVASLAFGPKRVLLIVGKNKLVDSIDEGIERTRRDCCPKNARRQNLKTPCSVTDKCTDCSSPDRMCNIFTVTEYAPKGFREYHIILVDEDLGR